MDNKIDIDKFICSLIERQGVYKNNHAISELQVILGQQGLKYKDGELVEIDQPPLTEEQKAYIEEGLKNGSMIRWKDLAYAEPKFKAGDWLVNKKLVSEPFCITQVNEPHYYLTNQDSFIKFGEEDKYRPWNIKDAKPGDVLMYEGYYNSIVLFHGIGLNGEGHINYYCKCDLANYDVSTQGDVAYMGDVEHSAKYYHPATKEQRGLLFKKMEEAGYIWNQDTLTLEKKRLFSKIRFDEPRTKDELIELRDDKGEKVLVPREKIIERLNEIRLNESVDLYSWSKQMADEMQEDIVEGTIKVKEELRKYFANNFSYLFKVDVDKMVEEYKESLNSAFLPLGYYPSQLNEFTKVYRRGLEDMLKLIKGGGK